MAATWKSFRGATFKTAIDDFELQTHGAAESIQRDPNDELREALAYMQADLMDDGASTRRKIDGVDVFVRRCGWRLQVWGVEDAEPAPERRDMPPGGEALDENGKTPVRPPAKLAISDRLTDGSPAFPARVEELPALLRAHKAAVDAGQTELAARLQEKIDTARV